MKKKKKKKKKRRGKKKKRRIVPSALDRSESGDQLREIKSLLLSCCPCAGPRSQYRLARSFDRADRPAGHDHKRNPPCNCLVNSEYRFNRI